MRATREQLLLMNLREASDASDTRHFIPRDVARDELRRLTGEDFGFDAWAWEEWFLKNDPMAVDWDGSMYWRRMSTWAFLGRVLLSIGAAFAMFGIFHRFLQR